MHGLYVFHIFFKICRPFRRKYKLAVNCILLLNASYLLMTITNNKPFTRSQLRSFASYYDMVRVNSYITVLVSRGFIVESGKYNSFQLYCISEKGIKVIEELKESYDSQLCKFCNDNNISL